MLRFVLAVCCCAMAAQAAAQDYEREARWADETLPTLVVGGAGERDTAGEGVVENEGGEEACERRPASRAQ